jgi:hypothetical protein
MQVRAWQAVFDWPIDLADSKRVGHAKQQRKMLTTRENHKIEAE